MSRHKPQLLGDLDGTGLRIAIVAARFNDDLVDRLVTGAIEALEELGVDADSVTLVRVPGAFELPVVAQRLAQGGNLDGIVALGVVIRGGTPHFDYVCDAATTGLEAVARLTGVPVGFGLLTTDDWDQAQQRAGGEHGNKGAEAATAVVETINVLGQLT